jgi:putative ABC transport system permease protein
MILGEALIQSLIGGTIGLGLGIGAIKLMSQAPAVAGLISGEVPPVLAVQAMVIALVLGLVGGGYPAIRAARLAPVEAMRAESGATVNPGPLSRFLSLFLRGNAMRNLLRRPARTLMSLAGLGLGVGFIVALSGITAGAETMFTSLLSAGQADMLVEQANVSDAAFSTIDERTIDQLRLHPEVRSVSSMVMGFSNVPGLPFFIIYGLDPREEYIAHYAVTEGRGLQRPDEMLLGRLAANSLEKGVGDDLRVSGRSFEIVGIFETGAAFEDTGAVITLREAQRAFDKPRQVSFAGITLHDPSQAERVAAELEARYDDVMVAPTADMTERMNDFESMDAAFSALLALMLLVGGIVMMNVMMMSVFERTREIGVLRAVGWSQWRILRTILSESLALSMFGAISGIGIGLFLNWLLSLVPLYGMLQAEYTVETFFQAAAMALTLGVIGGLLPAFRATRLSPIEALHYE